MPLTKIAFAPGIYKQDTEYGAAGRWTDSDFETYVQISKGVTKRPPDSSDLPG